MKKKKDKNKRPWFLRWMKWLEVGETTDFNPDYDDMSKLKSRPVTGFKITIPWGKKDG